MADSSEQLSKAVLYVNAKARRGGDDFEEARKLLEEAGIELTKAECFESPPRLIEAVKRSKNVDRLVIVGGGDGTLSAAVNVLAKSDSILGVVPLGTGNALARDLGIATDIPTAVKVIVEGKTAKIDLGVTDHGYFVNVATIGLASHIADGLTGELKKRLGPFAYLSATWRALQRIKVFRVHLATENGDTEQQAVQVVIGNGHYHAGPFPLAPEASITNGRQQIYIVKGDSKLALFKYALALPLGQQGAIQDIHSESAVGGVLTTTPRLVVTIDGEPGSRTPLRFSTDASALAVRVPSDFTG